MANGTNAVLDALQEELNVLIQNSGQNVGESQKELDSFLESIAPEVDQAIAEGSVMSLSFLRDRIAMRVGAIFLNASENQKVMIAGFVSVAIRTAIKILIV